MVFSSAIFVFGFLPILLAAYFLLPKKLKNWVLLIFSLVFYSFGGLNYVFVLMFTVLVSYTGGMLLGAGTAGLGAAPEAAASGPGAASTAAAAGPGGTPETSAPEAAAAKSLEPTAAARQTAAAKNAAQAGRRRKAILAGTLTLNLLALLYFKYTGFILSNLDALFHLGLEIPDILLPIGISFYTFQSISYVVDVYRGEVQVQRNYFLLLLYVSLFPQLIAGPIVRYKTIEHSIRDRQTTLEDFCCGVERFILGLAKKVIIANQMGKLADIVFAGDSFETPCVWLAAIAYMMQIYFDFSAYSDMAIGLGRILGFHFLENFNFPYISKSVTEFWRRWHISLSSFFRDYVYIPLGGNRCSPGRHIFNLCVVWVLTGFWHGASWNFVLWGIYYLLFLLLEKFLLGDKLERIPAAVRHAGTLLVVLMGWMLFRFEDLSVFWDVAAAMWSFDFNAVGLSAARIYVESYFLYFLLAFLFSTPVYYVVCGRLERHQWFTVIKYAGLLCLFVVTIMFLAQSSYNPFIYFRF